MMWERPFEGILGNNCELRLLEYLMSLPDFDFNITELAKVSGVSRQSTDRVIKKFLKWNIVNMERKIGNISVYKLNRGSPLVAATYEFNNRIIENLLPEGVLEEARIEIIEDIKAKKPKLEPEMTFTKPGESPWEIKHEPQLGFGEGDLYEVTKLFSEGAC